MTAKRDSTTVMWRVQVRSSRRHKWVNKGLFETREAARDEAQFLRNYTPLVSNMKGWGYGFGNTRVLRFEKKGRK